jgi:hypothetical protein
VITPNVAPPPYNLVRKKHELLKGKGAIPLLKPKKDQYFELG